MPSTSPKHEVIPDAHRLITSLRDIGYDFMHAVADVIDNSLDAGATRVDVDVRFEGPDSWLRISDNGAGMAGSQITEAMRYGSRRKYAAMDKGKFGLGLKTASLSQCSRLSVASRTDVARRRIETRVLDVDHIEKVNKWEVYELEDPDDRLMDPLAETTGTVVLWTGLQRVLKYKVAYGERAKAGLFNKVEQLERYLAMVFHRFLAGQA